MLNPNNPEDILSIEKSRNIIKEILDYGVNQNEVLKLIELLSLELEDREKMNGILSIIKNQNEENSNQKKELVI